MNSTMLMPPLHLPVFGFGAVFRLEDKTTYLQQNSSYKFATMVVLSWICQIISTQASGYENVGGLEVVLAQKKHVKFFYFIIDVGGDVGWMWDDDVVHIIFCDQWVDNDFRF